MLGYTDTGLMSHWQLVENETSVSWLAVCKKVCSYALLTDIMEIGRKMVKGPLLSLLEFSTFCSWQLKKYSSYLRWGHSTVDRNETYIQISKCSLLLTIHVIQNRYSTNTQLSGLSIFMKVHICHIYIYSKSTATASLCPIRASTGPAPQWLEARIAGRKSPWGTTVKQMGILKPKWVFPKIRVPQNGWFVMENPY